MKVSLILNHANKSWIIEKIAVRLAEELGKQGVNATIDEAAQENADIVHHMSWAFANIKTRQPSTMFITHLDDSHKVAQVKSMLGSRTVSVGICMSSDTMEQMVSQGVNESQLAYVLPAHDGALKPRRIVLGFTTRLYADGRKREQLLIDVAKRMPLDSFEFQIFGTGWDAVVPVLENAGAKVEWHRESDDYRKDYAAMVAAIPRFDYYIYLGLDEGSLGTLDALAAGVKTIVTPQGFHLNLVNGITHPVLTSDDLFEVFQTISMQSRGRIDGVADLSWTNYARHHVDIWTALLQGKTLPRPDNASLGSSDVVARMRDLRDAEIKRNALSPRRILARLSRARVLKPLRAAFDRYRLKH